ncbi:MAG TPA: hypothetical protein VKQ31_05700 [Steroidobacteraceae bacterium]|nr:hypothetical protein [Steroidobacteraceae bacterium]
MPKMLTTTRSLLIAGALAFATLPALAQTSPQTQPAAPATSGSNMSGASTDTGTTNMGTTNKTTTGKTTHHTRKIASTHKSNVHRVSSKKHITSSKTKKPTGSSMGGSSTGTGTGTGGTQPQ